MPTGDFPRFAKFSGVSLFPGFTCFVASPPLRDTKWKSAFGRQGIRSQGFVDKTRPNGLQFPPVECENEISPASAWCVLHVKPRTEKKMAERLRRCRVWHYLPLWTKVRRVQRRKVRTELPLFPGYVFARLNSETRLEALKSNMVVRVIPVPRQRELIHQLRQVAHAGRAGREVRTAAVFKSGDRVRVTQGPFYGVEGYIRRDEGGASVVLNVDILGQAVAVAISPSDCEQLS